MKRNLISAIIFILTVIAALVSYVIIFSRFDYIWFNFNAIFYLCLATFLAGVGIFISAVLVEKR